MKVKMKKVISILLVFIIIIFTLSSVVWANPTEAMNGYQNNANSGFLNNIGSQLYGIILVVGSAVALIMLAIMAIKFMTSGAEEKAQVKKNLIGFTIGVLILLCTISILGIFKNIGEEISSSATSGQATISLINRVNA